MVAAAQAAAGARALSDRGLGHCLADLLARAGYCLPTDPVKVQGDTLNRVWRVVGVVVQLLEGNNLGVSYRLQSFTPDPGLCELLVAPQLVTPIPAEEPQVGGTADPEGPPAGPGCPAPAFPDGRVCWTQTGATARESTCGRFRVEARGDGALAHFAATDWWTGGDTASHTTEHAALSWCEGRYAGGHLRWRHGGGQGEHDGFFASTPRGEKFAVREDVQGRWYGVDERFGLEALDLRHGPGFDSPDQAKRWCEVRAVCDVGTGLEPYLKYVGPIPF